MKRLMKAPALLPGVQLGRQSELQLKKCLLLTLFYCHESLNYHLSGLEVREGKGWRTQVGEPPDEAGYTFHYFSPVGSCQVEPPQEASGYKVMSTCHLWLR